MTPADVPTPDATGAWQELPASWLNASPAARCNRCGRSTWDADGVGQEDRMTQPDGNPVRRPVHNGGDAMTDPTPDAIRPEWVEAGARALSLTPANYLQTATQMATTVIAAVCGDIVEAARREVLTEALAEIEAVDNSDDPWIRQGASVAARIVTDLRDRHSDSRRPRDAQSDVGAESAPVGEPPKPEALSGGTS